MARKKHPPAPSSTDVAQPPPLRFTLALDRVNGLGEELAIGLGVANAAAVLARLRDPGFVRERLTRAAPLTLGVLEILVDFEGLVQRDVLDRVVIERLGVGPDDIEMAVESLFGTMLAVPLTAKMHHASRNERLVMLMAESSASVAAALRGLSLPTSPPDVSPGVAARRPLRDRVAFLAALAHVAVRATSSDMANRATTKKLGALSGLDAHGAADLVDDAVLAGLVGVRSDRLVPRVEALRAMARGEPAPSDADQEWIASRIPRDRWLSFEALARELVRADHVHANAPYFERFGLVLAHALPEHRLVEPLLRSRAWLMLADHAGVPWVRLWPEGGSESGDGHVTPAFEVMLGPDADPRLTLTIALAAEPVRFDTVLTFKLTPASIGAALTLGLDASVILGALDRVGRHAVPENVRLMIGDWARSVRTATIRKAWVIETNGPDAADAAARSLGASVLARPTPTMLLVDDTAASPGATLGKGGVHASAEVSRSLRAEHASIEPQPLATPTPSLELVSRLEVARATKGGLSIPTASLVRAIPQRVGPVQLRMEPEGEDESDEFEALLAAMDDDDDDDHDENAPSDVLAALLPHAHDSKVFATINRLAERWLELEDPFLDWARRRAATIGDAALDRAGREPWVFLPLLVLRPAAQRRVLRDARSVDEMLAQARKLVTAGDAVEHPELFVHAMHESVQKMFGVVGSVAESSQPNATKHESPVRTADTIREAFARAIDRGASVTLRVHSKTQGDRNLRLRPERVLVRGADVTLLGTELGTELGRSFPLANIRELVVETS